MVSLNNDREQQDFITNKLLLVFTMVFIGIFCTMYLYRSANSSAEGFMFLYNLTKNMIKICAVGTIITALKTIIDRKKPKINKYKLVTAKHLCPIFLVIGVCFVLIDYFSIFVAVKYIYMILTVVAIQYFVLVSYSSDIYLITITNLANLFLTYCIGQSPRRAVFFAIISAVFLATMFIFIKIMENNHGKIREIEIFKENANYKMLTLNILTLVLITIVSVMLSVIGHSFGVIIGGIYLIVIIFYNTLKLF